MTEAKHAGLEAENLMVAIVAPPPPRPPQTMQVLVM